MHSRIFQVSMNPINKEEYIYEGGYYEHWFTREIADYVSDDCDRGNGIKWLSDCAKGYNIEVDTNGEYLIVTSKGKYFEDAYERFMKALRDIENPTLEEFTNGIDLWHLKDAYEDKFGFYVDADGELMTFDAFIRECVINEKYYIGGVVDYHF